MKKKNGKSFQFWRIIDLHGYWALIIIGSCLAFPGFVSAQISAPEEVSVVSSHLKAMTDEQQLAQFKVGLKAARSENWDEAYAIWQTLNQSHFLLPEIRMALENNLAVLLIKQKRFEEAEKRLDSALQADDLIAVTLQNLNEIYAYQAQKAYQQVFKKSFLQQPEGHWLDLEMPQLQARKKVLEVRNRTSAQLTRPSVDKTENIDDSDSKGIALQIEKWRRAWASQNALDYFQLYHKTEFIPGNGINLAEWHQDRNHHIRTPNYIRLKIEQLQVVPVTEDFVRTQFIQHYQSNRISQKSLKALLWKKDADASWKIVQEVELKSEND